MRRTAFVWAWLVLVVLASTGCKEPSRGGFSQVEWRNRLKDSSAPKRVEAIEALVKTELFEQMGNTKPLEDWVVLEVMEALKDPDAKVRSAAVRGLSLALVSNQQRATLALISALNDADAAVRAETAKAFCVVEYFQDDAVPTHLHEAVPALLVALADRDFTVRLQAARAIGAIRPKTQEPITALEQAVLADPFNQVRDRAAQSLGMFKQGSPNAKHAKAALVAILKESTAKKQPYEVSVYLFDALREMETDANVLGPAIFAYYKQTGSENALRSLQRMGFDAIDAKELIPELFKNLKLDRGDRGTVLSVLWELKLPATEAVPGYIEVLQSKNSRARACAAMALKDIGPEAKAAVPALIDALNDKEYWTRGRVVEALAAIGPDAKAAVPSLLSLLKEEKNEAARRLLLEMLNKIDPTAVKHAGAQ